nr:MAG TPA: hypothetical protein [Caudoviricetes sp.]DAQ69776.1 MAG TPA: hypothetical protein [Caudoviricetes sp.]DAZ10851.1 MAG TPA: hypothetical protein [Caudoviricetes sp.]
MVCIYYTIYVRILSTLFLIFFNFFEKYLMYQNNKERT